MVRLPENLCMGIGNHVGALMREKRSIHIAFFRPDERELYIHVGGTWVSFNGRCWKIVSIDKGMVNMEEE